MPSQTAWGKKIFLVMDRIFSYIQRFSMLFTIKFTFNFVKVLFFLLKVNPSYAMVKNVSWLFLFLCLYFQYDERSSWICEQRPYGWAPLITFFNLFLFGAKWEAFERLSNPPTAFPLSFRPSLAQTTRAAEG